MRQTNGKKGVQLQLLYPLLDFISDRLICTHERLLIDHDLRRICLGSTDSRRNRRRVRFHDDPINTQS